MIKLWKDEKKNEELKNIIAQLRNSERGIGFRYFNRNEKIGFIANKFNCSYTMAEKVVWILCGDCARQIEICKALGKEYAMYVPSGCE